MAQGFSQCPGVDFDETFAPTTCWAAVQNILALAALDDMHLEFVNISSAFLHGVIDTKLYMKFPKGFLEEVPPDIQHKLGEGLSCAKLEKGIYGLIQGTNLWNKYLHSVLFILSFTRITSNLCIYVYFQDGVYIIILIHIDNMTFALRSAILKVISELCKYFHFCHLRPTTALLGIVATHNWPLVNFGLIKDLMLSKSCLVSICLTAGLLPHLLHLEFASPKPIVLQHLRKLKKCVLFSIFKLQVLYFTLLCACTWISHLPSVYFVDSILSQASNTGRLLST